MVDSGPSVWEIVGVAGFLFVVLLLGYYALTRLRTRRKKLSLELDTSRELVEDRAFNQLRLARTEADLLDRQGVDVSGPRQLLEEAESARGRRDFDSALAMARSAHEALVRLHRSPPASPGGPSETALPPGPAPSPARAESVVPLPFPSTVGPLGGPPGIGGRGGTAPEEPPRAALPKNKAESKFQLTILSDELSRASSERPTDTAIPEAADLRAQASAAFDREEYTDALRLALRGRRRLGARLETFPARPETPPSTEPAAPEEPLRCRSCGEALRANDRFCRYCGTLRGPARCEACGAPLEPNDRFCSACGRPIGDITPS